MNSKAVALALVITAPLFAQDAKLVDRLDKKLAKGFVAKTDWVQDYDAARRSAADSGKLVLAYFTRSYAP